MGADNAGYMDFANASELKKLRREHSLLVNALAEFMSVERINKMLFEAHEEWLRKYNKGIK